MLAAGLVAVVLIIALYLTLNSEKSKNAQGQGLLKGTTATYLRVMPNTPALVGKGMTAICDDTTFLKEDFDYAKGIFDSIGKTRILLHLVASP